MLDIGLEVKILRERLKISSKDLAAKIGFSQSQMSRLEKGQRRIDTRVLHKISEALGVKPAFFFRGSQESGENREETELEIAISSGSSIGTIAPALRFDHLGKLIRSERRKKHLTVDELATKVGKTKAYMIALEEGRHGVDRKLADKICRALRLTPSFFIETQQSTIDTLRGQVARLDQALVEVNRGNSNSTNGCSRGQRVPLYGSLGLNLDLVFDSLGNPAGEPEDFLHIPALESKDCFALTLAGDSMKSSGNPSFSDGDILVFSVDEARNKDFVLIQMKNKPLVFRQIFYDPAGDIRLQPLNLNHAGINCSRESLLSVWKLVLHIARI